MDVFLVRHALAQERDPDKWPDDRARPLRPSGIRRFRSAARGLARLATVPDVVWSSRLARAWHTAVILHEEAGWPEPEASTLIEEELDPTRVLRAISRANGIERLALVGHAPGLDDLAAIAVLGPRRNGLMRLRKGGVACLRFEPSPGPGAAELLWLANPTLLRAAEE